MIKILKDQFTNPMKTWGDLCTLCRALNEEDQHYKINAAGMLHLNKSKDLYFPDYSPEPIGRVDFVEIRPIKDPDLWVAKLKVVVMPETWEISQPFSDESLALRHLWENRARCKC